MRIFVLFTVVVFGYCGYFGYKIHKLQSEIVELAPIGEQNKDDQEAKGFMTVAKSIIKHERIELRGEKDGRVNILLLGMGGEGHKGKYLTDTIMLVSISPKTYQSAMLSIPRDLYVKIPNSTGIHTKINAVYAYEARNKQSSAGESFASIKKAVRDVTGQDVHYFVALNFDGFKKIIDELGGIDIEVENDIHDSRFPGPNYSYETFKISKGFHHLDAETALKYARVRHTKGGDFGRAKRQQQVIAATKRKAFSLKTIANPTKITGIIDLLSENLKTDIQLSEIPSFLHYARNINIYQTTTIVLDAWSPDSLLGSTHVEMGGIQAYVLMPRAKNFSQIYELSENIFDLKKIEQKKVLVENEDASIAVIPANMRDQQKIRDIFKKFGHKITIERFLDNVNCDPQKNVATSFTSKPKLFTLNDLAVKLEADVAYKSGENENYDIAICLSKDTVHHFEKQYQNKEEIDEKLMEEADISEDGKVLYSENNK
ncbi:MAG: LCP family protein [Patescibacteria group bacterium]|nr:LCP family protein [Patescibacteria group bacterium]